MIRRKKLMPLYDKYKDKYHCVYQTDIYTNEQWLEIMPLEASKSNAIRQLQSMMNCEKLIVFGDGKNDIDMFQMADKSYAVANAHNDLKAICHRGDFCRMTKMVLLDGLKQIISNRSG